MEKFLNLAFLFFIGSMGGWILEILFRRIITTKKWINPGFLVGPYLPIYGFGLCTLYLISRINFNFIDNIVIKDLLVILFMTISMTIIEYIAGMIFIKGMNVKLWDYSNEWGNIKGIICPLYSFFWAVLGAIYYFFINPTVLETINWLYENLAFSFFIGMFFATIIIDASMSMNLAVRLRKISKENNILVKLEELKNNIREDAEKSKEKIHYIFALKSNKSFAELLHKYREKHIKKEKNI